MCNRSDSTDSVIVPVHVPPFTLFNQKPIHSFLGILVDKDDLINYQLLIIYGLLLRIFTYQPTVDKTIRDINQLLITRGSVDDS